MRLAIYQLVSLLPLVNVALAVVPKWNDNTIRAADDQHDALLLLFTIPENCPNCLTYVEKFQANADELDTWLKANLDDNSTVGIGIMDLRDSEVTANDLQVEGAPSIVLVRGQYIHEYGGPLSADTLGPWIQRRMQGAITHLKTEEAVKTFQSEYPVAVVAYANDTGLRLFEQVTEPLREIPQYGWFNVSDPDDPMFNKIVVAKEGLKANIVGELKSNVTDVQLWLLQAQMPLVGEISLSNIQAYLQERRPFIWFVGLRHQFDSIKHELYPLTQLPEFYEKFWWVWLNPASSEQTLHFVDDKLKPRRIPSFLITDFEGPGRFHFTNSFPTVTGNDLADWVKAVVAGKEERDLISEEVPGERVDSKTKVEKLVGKLVEAILLRRKDREREDELFVMITTPACHQPCQEMLEVMGNMNRYLIPAQMDRESCKLRMLVIDAYRNELDPRWNLNANQYPTTYFLPKISEESMKRLLAADLNNSAIEVARLEKIPYSGSIHESDIWDWLTARSGCHLQSLGRLKVDRPRRREAGYDEL
eukprot:Protomagalhaensia_sp_Gyna_25__459@NODE_1217_length_2056_cov_53_360932_g969_i0_p1_GENE_NODE_1217_length_2056_cov_53_360932_g969_i0NODE_1217_length_2056_cov_53_360932_g969_i0_p1_ORF_typecomplete_len533_score84_37Thioredoxin_6/PF13848_6/2_8e03Thioredoxin_6/PF13848_6/0_002Thioredoxin_6/PF13848_6/2_3e08Thioredoxin_6/PF13848_6/6_1e03Thioredoxin/PF00085_20/0_0012Thioredoxin/PF00085_20/5Calsequestrin/PF01216_17/1_9e06Thioredoxin_2/PF13098_6/2_1Thioredoxin_2/PF13098_6/67AhpCTSA/PF00578_21/0_037_NODE_1217